MAKGDYRYPRCNQIADRGVRLSRADAHFRFAEIQTASGPPSAVQGHHVPPASTVGAIHVCDAPAADALRMACSKPGAYSYGTLASVLLEHPLAAGSADRNQICREAWRGANPSRVAPGTEHLAGVGIEPASCGAAGWTATRAWVGDRGRRAMRPRTRLKTW